MNAPKDQLSSMLDKTDWRSVIQDTLEGCVYTRGKMNYRHAVESALSALAIKYPNWDAFTIIHTTVKKIVWKHKLALMMWIVDHQQEWAFPWIYEDKKIDYEQELCKEIDDYLKNITGTRRMLLLGSKKTTQSNQSDLPGVNISDEET